MTLTATPNTSAAVEQAAFGNLDEVAETWLTTTDHRKVGGLLAGAALVLGTIGLAVAGLVSLRVDAAIRGTLPSTGFLGADPEGLFSWSRLFAEQRHMLTFLVIAPLFLALATIAVPRLIGSTRMAFPRLQAGVLWGHIAGAALVIAAYSVGDGPPEFNVFSSSIPTDKANAATDLLLGGLMLLAFVSLLGAINVVATVLTQRRPGLRLDHVAPFAWASLVASAITVIAAPVFLGGALLVYLDRHFGGSLFDAQGFGRVWLHTVFYFGRPEALLILVPALGVATQIVANRTTKGLLGGPAHKILLALVGFISLFAWAGGDYLLTAMVQPTSRWITGVVLVPTGLLVLLWLGSLASGAKPDASLLFVVALVVLLALGLLNVIVAGARDVTDPSLGAVWTFNQTNLLLISAPLVIALGGLLEFAPIAWGRKVMPPLAGLAGLAALGGGVLHAVGLAGISYKDDVASSASALGVVALVGGLLLAGAAALTGLNLLGSIVARKGELVDTVTEEVSA